MIRSLLLAAGLTFGLAGTAFAHAHLQSATPPVGGTVTVAPAEVVITYSEGVEPRFSTIVVQDAKGQRVDEGAPQTAPGNNKRLSVKLKPLGAGVYSVEWHATSVDTHKTEGKFQFTVAP